MDYASLTPVEQTEDVCPHSLDETVLTRTTPLVMKGLVREWPVVQAASAGIHEACEYLLSFYHHKPVHLMHAPGEVKGRLFYNDDLSGFNFTRRQADLHEVLTQLIGLQQTEQPDTYYVGSTSVQQVLPGFKQQNDIPQLADKPLHSIWIGNQSRIAAHYDATDNVACVVAGKRRFTLFPPSQARNLYVGPLDFTPAGQAASLVDFDNVDYQRYPRFKEAVQHAMIAELEPGDAVFIPAMWWHHVAALTPFNVLINYWWRQVPDYVGVPFDALAMALLSIRDLPQAQRDAWRDLFDQYVFNPMPQTHIPDSKLGMLGDIDETMARRLRAMLLNRLNR